MAERTRAAADALAAAGYEVVEGHPPRFEEVDRDVDRLHRRRHPAAARPIGPLMSRRRQRLPRRDPRGPTPELDLAGYTGVLDGPPGAHARVGACGSPTSTSLLTPTWTQLPFAHGWDVESAEQLAGDARDDALRDAGQRARAAVGVRAGRPRRRPARGCAAHGDRFADDKTLAAAEVVEAALGLATPIDPISF